MSPDDLGDIQGRTYTAQNGQQYFQTGKNRIKITEHFPYEGKAFADFIEEMAIHKKLEKINKNT